MNFFNFIFVNFILFLWKAFAEIHVNNIDLRPPKWNDIGLIFDVSILNTVDTEKETLEIRIRGEKCCLNISSNEQLCNINRIIGGYFGPLEPGEATVVSVLLPTVTLYNRVGNCAIGVMSLNASEFRKKVVHQFPFDTTIKRGNVPAVMKQYIGTRNFSDCATADLDPFNKCKPVSCEEKYFGKRGFFDNSTKLCKPVPKCIGKGVLYDMFENECVDVNNFFTKYDIEMLQSGQFDNNTWILKRSVEVETNDNSSNTNHGNGASINEERKYRRVTWEEFSHAVLVIFATIGIYLFICFIIFLIIAWMSKRKSMKLPSEASFDCPPSKSGMSIDINREVDETRCIPYPEKPQPQQKD